MVVKKKTKEESLKERAEILQQAEIVATYKLTEPVLWGEEKIYILEFRTLKAKHIFKVQRENIPEIEQLAMLMQLSTRADPYVIENLSIKDFMGASKILNDFLLKDLPSI